MQLTRFSDLTLRLLMYLGSRREPDQMSTTVRTASDLFQVPYTHMVKVVHQLGRDGLIATSKGRGGGLKLARDPREIRVGDVLRKTEGGKALIDCAAPGCPLRGGCILKSALDAAYDAFFTELNRYTLADLAESPKLQSLVKLTYLPTVH